MKNLESDDPMELVGISCDSQEFDEMMYAFVEEFVRMGWSFNQIIALFKDPFFRGPHQVWQVKGQTEVEKAVRAVSSTLWRKC